MINIFKETQNSLMLDLNVNEANLSNAEEFKAELLKLIAKTEKTIVLNLNQVEYIDSSFLGALVSVLKHLLAKKTDLVLVGLRKDITDLFSLIRLDKVFKIYQNFDEVPKN